MNKHFDNIDRGDALVEAHLQFTHPSHDQKLQKSFYRNRTVDN